MQNKRSLTMESTVRTLSIKVYHEQFPHRINHIKDLDASRYHVIAIKHDKDTNYDDIWLPSVEKPHFHIIVRVIGSPVKVRTLLHLLKVEYRVNPKNPNHWGINDKGERYLLDEKLWDNHGVETVSDFCAMSMYLTHETDQAIKDGKYKYPFSCLVSNLTDLELQGIRKGYVSGLASKGKLDVKQQAILDSEAYRLGYNLGDFTSWYNSLDFVARKGSLNKLFRESYNRGVDNRVLDNPIVCRLCVYLQGPPNIGKTYALSKLKYSYTMDGGGTGAFDNLYPYHNTLIVNDSVVPDLLNLSDNKICKVYRRGSNNPWWSGRCLVVTSNLTFSQWLVANGFSLGTLEFNAVKSRFYTAVVGSDLKIYTESVSVRGTVEEQQDRLTRYIELKDYLEKSFAEYDTFKHTNHIIDYSCVLGDGFVSLLN